MYILNITFLVARDAVNQWNDWISSSFIPSIIATGHFNSPQLARVHTPSDDEGLSYALQFRTEHLHAIDRWLSTGGASLQQVCTGRFNGNVLFFATTLEVISH
ncbi:MAG: DUF4286 family protein [Bacteroidales bacterium]|jgi:glutathione S-transferase|nr:DUF4286 family protein [Bacteroidales bacterium]